MIMSYNILPLINLALFLNLSCMLQLKAQPTHSSSIPNELESMITNYHLGLINGDINLIKKVVTHNFIKEAGGEKLYTKFLIDNSKKYKDSYIIIDKTSPFKGNTNKVFIKFGIFRSNEKKSEETFEWFLAERINSSSTFKLAAILHDFEPD